MLTKITKFAGDRPLAFALILMGCALAFYFGVSAIESGLFERGVDQNNAEQEGAVRQVDQLQNRATTSNAEGDLMTEQADEQMTAARKTGETVKRKKDYANQIKKQADDVGRRDIADPDVPSNAELCARANSLGVRCDSGG